MDTTSLINFKNILGTYKLSGNADESKIDYKPNSTLVAECTTDKTGLPDYIRSFYIGNRNQLSANSERFVISEKCIHYIKCSGIKDAEGNETESVMSTYEFPTSELYMEALEYLIAAFDDTVSVYKKPKLKFNFETIKSNCLIHEITFTDLKKNQVIWQNGSLMQSERYSLSDENSIFKSEEDAQEEITNKLFDTIMKNTLEEW